MYVLGHLGIGLELSRPWSRRLPKKWVLLGTLLPDLIDKPLYYGLSWLYGKSGAELGLISGTRTFGHTALALIVMSLAAVSARARWLAAICIGVATHLLLDNLGEHYFSHSDSTLHALLWPFMGRGFPIYPFHSVVNQMERITEPYFLISEVVGAALLVWEYWKWNHVRKIRL